MSRSYSVFIDDMYYYDFVALYNSWKYYENKIPLKVYLHRGLSDEKLNTIKKYCEVIEVHSGDFSDSDWNGKCLFKYVGLLKNMSDYEIVLDADTLFLSNMDYLFDYIEDGKIVASVENEWNFVHRAYYKTDEELEIANKTIKNEFRKTLGDDIDKYSLDFTNKVYNGGFFGFNKKNHSYLLETTIKLLTNDFKDMRNPIFHNEQYMINFLIELYNVEVISLPYNEWMNTWHNHKNPKKIIKVEDGKLVLYNENGNRINLYHFTGDIGMMHSITNSVMTCRPHQIYETAAREIFFEKKDVYNLWLKRHENPVILLYQYFADMGL
jgi:hypothetical protein